MSSEVTGTLRVGEAVELAHALLARLAELEGVRILFIKGPTAVVMGARPPRPSSDVDVLCEPGGMEKLGAALEACGWRRRVPEGANTHFVYAAKYLFEHSVHYIHDEWPCDLDIHFNFPGFFAPDDVVFEALWERRSTVRIAHWPVPCADFLGQATIVGLHSLRDSGAAPTSPDLEFLSNALSRLEQVERAELAALAADTGSSETLRPLLERVGVSAQTGPWSDRESLRHWRARTQNAGIYTTSWLIELGKTPWHRKPGLIWRALFLPSDELLSSHVGLDPTRSNIVRLQAKRWGRALRHLQQGLQAARRTERGHP